MTCSSCGAPFTPPRGRGGRPRTRCDACRSHHAKIDGKKWRDLRTKLLAGVPPCVICGDRVATEVDHIVPLAQGGEPYELWNVQPVCKPCNASKAARVRNFGEAGPPPAPSRPDLPPSPGPNAKVVYDGDGRWHLETALEW